MSRLGRVMFLVERTRRTRPTDVAAVAQATAEQASRQSHFFAIPCPLQTLQTLQLSEALLAILVA